MTLIKDKYGSVRTESDFNKLVSLGLIAGDTKEVTSLEGLKPDAQVVNEGEYNWAKSELEASDIEIKYHERGSKRAELTVEKWYTYQEQLRDYATVGDNGVYSTIGDKPERPTL